MNFNVVVSCKQPPNLPSFPNISILYQSCSYLAEKFATMQGCFHADITGEDILIQRALCLCDDDNDLEMATACGRVFLPSVSSESMAKAAQSDPDKIKITERIEENVIETLATESALLEGIKILKNRSVLRP
jgi:hypothetical protein